MEVGTGSIFVLVGRFIVFVNRKGLILILSEPACLNGKEERCNRKAESCLPIEEIGLSVASVPESILSLRSTLLMQGKKRGERQATPTRYSGAATEQ